MGIFKKLGWYFKQEWRRYLLGVTFLLLVALVNLIPPKVIGDLVDAMSKSRLTSSHLALMLGLLLFSGISQYLFRYGWRNAGADVAYPAVLAFYENGCHLLSKTPYWRFNGACD